MGDVCTACGQLTRHHYGVSGAFMGCDVARIMGNQPKNPERWNDSRPDLTCEVRAALLFDCGPQMEIAMAAYTFHEALDVAHAVVKRLLKNYTITPKGAAK